MDILFRTANLSYTLCWTVWKPRRAIHLSRHLVLQCRFITDRRGPYYKINGVTLYDRNIRVGGIYKIMRFTIQHRIYRRHYLKAIVNK